MICGYIPHSNNLEYVNKLFCKLNELLKINYPFYIFGYFNYPNFNWGNFKKNVSTEKCQNILVQFLLKNKPISQIVSFPTCGASTLDILLINDPKSVSVINPLLSLGKSDHIIPMRFIATNSN